ncbi:TonB-dependent receptor plug domain-containing protein [Pseudoalteromonas umbrosa]|uniref:TonB-dependent receptor plug domain-containing protein n=1 Tax=Pseudoalteromonas umbrosa TaxID=3048489 RepID=UPI0024C3C10B|nr:TonB-dependent receptor [Pseudoalteromonas sp. B95]MDK1287803.1 TonB-dependent receptor [Pseudoalteromonas sp. B95]
MKKTIPLIFLFSFCLSAAASQDELFELSFEELLDVNITLATKTVETPTSVPSSTTVFNRQHIQLLGVANVYELMNFVPGMQSTRGDWVGAVPKEHARGIYLDSGNVLVMLNGQRLNDASFGKASVYAPFIPVEIIERVEFIRGPGSALYGSNAFLGVMNIVTKKGANQVMAAVGDNGMYQGAVSLHKAFDNGLTVQANTSLYRDDGDKYFEAQVRDPVDGRFLEIEFNWDNWRFAIHNTETRLDEFINLSGESKDNRHTSRNLGVQLEVNSSWHNSITNTTRLDFIKHDIKSAGLIASAEVLQLENGFFVGPRWQSRDLTLNSETVYTYDESLNVIFGAEYSWEEQSRADVYTNYYNAETGQIFVDEPYFLGGLQVISNHEPFKPLEASFDSYAVYTQLKYVLSESITMFTGLRYDDVVDIDRKLSPRLALIYQFNPVHTFKLQYGEAFRVPVSNELYSNDEVTSGNPSLKAEYLKTTELVWHAKNNNWQIDLVLFDNELEDFINLIPVDEAQSRFTFDNVFETSMQGLEFSGTLHISDNTWLSSTFTQYIDLPFNPSYKKFGSLVFNHRHGDIQYSFNGIWRDSITVIPAVLPDDPEFSPYHQPSHWLFGSTVSWKVDEKQGVALQVQNLFDKSTDAFDPRRYDGRVPQKGRQIRLRYTYDF